MSLWRWPACQTLLKAWDISSATAQVALELLKAIAIVRRPTVEWEDLIPCWKSEKDHISLGH